MELSKERLLGFLAFFGIVFVINAGYASSTPPKLPEGFCPKETGDITATTGECMCHWQHKDGCVGSECQFQYGLSWYHYTCDDCNCVAQPKK